MTDSNERLRAIFFVLLMLGVMAAAVAAVVGVAWFLRPDPIFMRAGMVQDFPAQDAPHYVELSRIHLFVFANEEEFVVLDATIPGKRRGNDLAWDGESNEFIDPESGQRYAADGTLVDTPSGEPMTQYPIYIQDGELWLDMREE